MNDLVYLSTLEADVRKLERQGMLVLCPACEGKSHRLNRHCDSCGEDVTTAGAFLSGNEERWEGGEQ